MRLTIKMRLVLLSGILLLLIAGSNLYMRSHIAAGGAALRNQAETLVRLQTATDALRSFGDMRYWFSDLQVSMLNESEEKAKSAAAQLDKQLTTLSAVAPQRIAEIRSRIKKYIELAYKAVDAYADEKRVLGNSILADARGHVQAIDEALTAIATQMRAGNDTATKRTLADMARASMLNIYILLGSAIVGVLLTWLNLRAILRPFAAMITAMRQLAGGDKSIAVPALGRRDEIGEMAQAVEVFKKSAIEAERMTLEQERVRAEREAEKAHLQQEEATRRAEREAEQEKRQAEREARARTLATLAEEFQANVAGMLRAVSSAVAELNSTASAMAGTAEETDRKSVAVASASEEATVNVQTVAAATEELSGSITEISRQVAQSTRIASQAVEETQRTDSTFKGLSEAAQKVGEVVSLINDIASQTNLLALNATIEAARAGEMGKGFAVVAAEVKSLATQTAKATEDIEAQIGAMQSATTGAVTAIKTIGETIAQINDITTTIASAVEEQGAATQEIARNVQQAAIGTEDVSANIVDVTKAAGVTGQSAKQVLESAEQLSKQAETLRREVEQFLTRIQAA